jgi:hypothetical protein
MCLAIEDPIKEQSIYMAIQSYSCTLLPIFSVEVNQPLLQKLNIFKALIILG